MASRRFFISERLNGKNLNTPITYHRREANEVRGLRFMFVGGILVLASFIVVFFRTYLKQPANIVIIACLVVLYYIAVVILLYPRNNRENEALESRIGNFYT